MFRSILLVLITSISPLYANPDETLKNMSFDQKIGQLFIAGLYSNKEDARSEGLDEDPISYIEKLIEDFHIGGILFKMRWNPVELHHFSNYFQSISKIPLFTALDAEWGLNMRMASAAKFPNNQALGAIQNDVLIYEMGREVGRQCRLIGINWNFSPVFDINSNPNNPIIHDRSFSKNKFEVAKRGVLMMKGLQDEGVLATAKHFPGHGDTSTDSHTGLPLLNHSLNQIEDFELYPFKMAIEEGVKSIMCAHILIPAIDSENPTSLSDKTINGLLKEKMGYEGLVITDDLLMKAVSKRYSPSESSLKAFLSGNDVILSSKDIEVSVAAIKQAVKEGIISETEIDRKVLKILKAKEWSQERGSQTPSILLENQLHTDKTYQIKQRLYNEAVNVFRDPSELLPVAPDSHITFIQINGTGFGIFYEMLNKRSKTSFHYLSQRSTSKEREMCYKDIVDENTIVIALMGMNRSFKDNFGVSKETLDFINDLAGSQKKIVVVLFGNPIISSKIDDRVSIILAYEEDPDAQLRAVEIVFEKKEEPSDEGSSPRKG